VRGNLAFAWRLQRSGGYPDLDARIKDVAGWLKIANLLERRAAELSGGEQQRVALARALMRKVEVALLDEPLGHLDAPLRLRLRSELPLLRSHFPATMIIVTHDPAEALALGDRIAVMHEGRIVQVDKPEAIRSPHANPLVAEMFRQA
jgi:ABC-type sugar transport system ATPase subunit